jgi:hypothetical protein
MAQEITVSQKELKRQAGLVFEGKTLNVMLCNISTTPYTAESTVADWQSIELSGSGYVRSSSIIETGTYDSQVGAYLIPEIEASFTATSTYLFNRVVLYIDGESYVHSVINELAGIVLSSGQTQTYIIKLRQDD